MNMLRKCWQGGGGRAGGGVSTNAALKVIVFIKHATELLCCAFSWEHLATKLSTQQRQDRLPGDCLRCSRDPSAPSRTLVSQDVQSLMGSSQLCCCLTSDDPITQVAWRGGLSWKELVISPWAEAGSAPHVYWRDDSDDLRESLKVGILWLC